jgi:hypothetical protein
MIHIRIDPVLFQWRDVIVGWHGLGLAAGLFVAYQVIVREGRRKGIARHHLDELLCWIAVLGYIGARLLHVLGSICDSAAENPGTLRGRRETIWRASRWDGRHHCLCPVEESLFLASGRCCYNGNTCEPDCGTGGLCHQRRRLGTPDQRLVGIGLLASRCCNSASFSRRSHIPGPDRAAGLERRPSDPAPGAGKAIAHPWICFLDRPDWVLPGPTHCQCLATRRSIPVQAEENSGNITSPHRPRGPAPALCKNTGAIIVSYTNPVSAGWLRPSRARQRF